MPEIKAIVPPETPGTTSAMPMAQPFSVSNRYCVNFILPDFRDKYTNYWRIPAGRRQNETYFSHRALLPASRPAVPGPLPPGRAHRLHGPGSGAGRALAPVRHSLPSRPTSCRCLAAHTSAPVPAMAVRRCRRPRLSMPRTPSHPIVHVPGRFTVLRRPAADAAFPGLQP